MPSDCTGAILKMQRNHSVRFAYNRQEFNRRSLFRTMTATLQATTTRVQDVLYLTAHVKDKARVSCYSGGAILLLIRGQSM